MRTDLPVMLMAPAEDLERARRFYELTVGLRLLQATQTEASYECPNGAILCLYHKPSEAEKVSLSWEVPNVDRFARQLEQRGIAVEEQRPARVSFRDTEGNLVSVVQSLR